MHSLIRLICPHAHFYIRLHFYFNALTGDCYFAMNLNGYYANLSYIHQFHLNERFIHSYNCMQAKALSKLCENHLFPHSVLYVMFSLVVSLVVCVRVCVCIACVSISIDSVLSFAFLFLSVPVGLSIFICLNTLFGRSRNSSK